MIRIQACRIRRVASGLVFGDRGDKRTPSRSAPPPHLVKRNRRGGVIPHYIFATARNGLSIYTISTSVRSCSRSSLR